jgi:glycosyltransferase involved in cell wall biosynthesis
MTEQALQHADVVLALTDVDHAGLVPLVRAPAALSKFPPFLDPAPYAAAAGRRQQSRSIIAERFKMDPSLPWLLTVGMMRNDVKRRSFEILGQALRQILSHSWQILVVGGGPSLPLVETYLAPLGSKRVRMAGILDEPALAACYAAADVYAWPAVREAYGLAMLEAQASGLPVVAGHEGGVAEVVRDTETGLLTPPQDSDAFALAVADLLDHPAKRRTMGRAARLFVERERSLHSASARLNEALVDAGDIFSARRAWSHANKRLGRTERLTGVK